MAPRLLGIVNRSARLLDQRGGTRVEIPRPLLGTLQFALGAL